MVVHNTPWHTRSWSVFFCLFVRDTVRLVVSASPTDSRTWNEKEMNEITICCSCRESDRNEEFLLPEFIANKCMIGRRSRRRSKWKGVRGRRSFAIYLHIFFSAVVPPAAGVLFYYLFQIPNTKQEQKSPFIFNWIFLVSFFNWLEFSIGTTLY